MSECTHDCSSCSASCDHRAPQHEPPHERSRIQKSDRRRVRQGRRGQSMTSAMLAVSMRRLGFKAGVLDADITGPHPRLFGVKVPPPATAPASTGLQPHRRGNYEHQPFCSMTPRPPLLSGAALSSRARCQAVLAGGCVGR